jgi:hypothetical protein
MNAQSEAVRWAGHDVDEGVGWGDYTRSGGAGRLGAKERSPAMRHRCSGLRRGKRI